MAKMTTSRIVVREKEIEGKKQTLNALSTASNLVKPPTKIRQIKQTEPPISERTSPCGISAQFSHSARGKFTPHGIFSALRSFHSRMTLQLAGIATRVFLRLVSQ